MAHPIKAAAFALAVLVAAASPGTAQEKLAPERSLSTQTGWWLYPNVTQQELAAALDKTKSRIVDLELNAVAPLKFSATLVQNSGPYASGWWWYVDQTGESLGKLLTQNKARLTNLNVYRVNGQLRFAAVMVSNTGANETGWWWYFDQTADGVRKLLDQNKARLVELQAYSAGNNQILYAAVMVSNQGPKATGWWWYLGQTRDQIAKLLDANKARILKLKHSVGGQLYDVIMVANPAGPENVGWWWWTDVPTGNLVELAARFHSRLFDVVPPVIGTTSYAGVAVDNGMPRSGDCGNPNAGADRAVTNWMKQWGIPGASVAVLKSGNLIYACGFGYADLAKVETVQPSHRFRLASITKLLTATAIRRLAADGKLNLSDKMLDRLGSAKPSGDPKDARLKDITIQHLLDHKGGWKRTDLGFDPMNHSDVVASALGVPKPSTCRDNITYMFKNHMLNFAPGTEEAYSNFGYCILGRIVDAVSGQNLEAYVKQSLLSPIGITKMQTGHSLIGGRLPDEVHYYDLPFAGTVKSIFPPQGQVPAPYGSFHAETGDADGAWIATAIDTARFVHLLKPEPLGDGGAFEGGLPGTATRVWRKGDFVVAVLFNGGWPEKDAKGNNIEFFRLTDDIAAGVSGSGNLWSKYGYR
jgi:CubicO group peptidase (beta-lactamase class C family)